MTNMTYNHTQYGLWRYVLFVFSVATLGGMWLVRNEPPVPVILLVIAIIFGICSQVFGSLTVRDEGESLLLHFGPLPVIRRRIRYADITGVEVGRTGIIDGWGMHYFPGRGWTYNIWGFDCAKLTLGRKVIRIGSDDAENLARFLRDATGLSGLSQ
jgi:hypothetical protein